MAVNCGPSFGLCAVRVTELDDTGNVTGNFYVTNNPVSVTLTPNIETGNTFSVRNGCGCKISSFRGEDTFNWWEFTFSKGVLDPAMEAMMLGGDIITDGSDEVGLNFPGGLACTEAPQLVAFEFWTQHIVAGGSGLDGTYPYIHWAFPASRWQLGDNTFEEDFATPSLSGFSRSNTNWGNGPYGDGPPDGVLGPEGGYWKTADPLPVGTCASDTVTPSS